MLIGLHTHPKTTGGGLSGLLEQTGICSTNVAARQSS
ncbi:hypothetical protein ABIB25_005510 [Nakamurella sp. UYEF19]